MMRSQHKVLLGGLICFLVIVLTMMHTMHSKQPVTPPSHFDETLRGGESNRSSTLRRDRRPFKRVSRFAWPPPVIVEEEATDFDLATAEKDNETMSRLLPSFTVRKNFSIVGPATVVVGGIRAAVCLELCWKYDGGCVIAVTDFGPGGHPRCVLRTKERNPIAVRDEAVVNSVRIMPYRGTTLYSLTEHAQHKFEQQRLIPQRTVAMLSEFARLPNVDLAPAKEMSDLLQHSLASSAEECARLCAHFKPFCVGFSMSNSLSSLMSLVNCRLKRTGLWATQSYGTALYVWKELHSEVRHVDDDFYFNDGSSSNNSFEGVGATMKYGGGRGSRVVFAVMTNAWRLQSHVRRQLAWFCLLPAAHDIRLFLEDDSQSRRLARRFLRSDEVRGVETGLSAVFVTEEPDGVQRGFHGGWAYKMLLAARYFAERNGAEGWEWMCIVLDTAFVVPPVLMQSLAHMSIVARGGPVLGGELTRSLPPRADLTQFGVPLFDAGTVMNREAARYFADNATFRTCWCRCGYVAADSRIPCCLHFQGVEAFDVAPLRTEKWNGERIAEPPATVPLPPPAVLYMPDAATSHVMDELAFALSKLGSSPKLSLVADAIHSVRSSSWAAELYGSGAESDKELVWWLHQRPKRLKNSEFSPRMLKDDDPELW